jgi:hypothetical protein
LFAALNAGAFASTVSRRERPFIMVVGAATVLLPLFGSWWGLLPESFRYVPEGLLLIPVESTLNPTWSPVSSALWSCSAVVVGCLAGGSMRDSVNDLARRNAMQTWNLKQMLPPEAASAPAKVS